MVPATYHDFFASCASVAGALTGLLARPDPSRDQPGNGHPPTDDAAG